MGIKQHLQNNKVQRLLPRLQTGIQSQTSLRLYELHNNMDEQTPEDLTNRNTQQPIVLSVTHFTFLLYICTLYTLNKTKNRIVIPLLLREVVQKRRKR